APAVVLLVSAKGKQVPDAASRRIADDAAERVKPAHACVVAAEKLQTEIDVFKASAKAAHVDADEPDAGAGPKIPKKQSIQGRIGRKLAEREKEPDVNLAWTAAQPSQKAAKLLNGCRSAVEASTGQFAEATPAWDAIAKAAAVQPAN